MSKFREYLKESIKIGKLEDKGYNTIELVDGRDRVKFIIPFDTNDSPSIIVNGKIVSILLEDLQKAVKELQKLI